MIDKIEDFGLMILEKIHLKKLADWYRKHREAMRYLIFGGLSTVVNIVIFTICFNYIKISTTASNCIAWIISVIFAYITNKIWVFYSKTDNIRQLVKEIISFLGARVFTLVFETIFLIIVIDKLHFNTIFMKIISNILVILMNFVFSKIFIFKKNK
ncbi:MAG: GtrA family protein [Clostridia bacterium]|nr:GtrA family protein [Clostridia bacterium]